MSNPGLPMDDRLRIGVQNSSPPHGTGGRRLAADDR